MANSDLSILIVDDTGVSAAAVGCTIFEAGYEDLRYVSSAHDALCQMQERPA